MRKLIFLCLGSVILHFSSYGQCSGTETGCPTIQMSGTALACYGDNDGTAAVLVTGGSGNYAYSWSTGPTATSSSISGLSAGTYTVAVTDNCTGCTVTGAYTVNAPNPIVLSGVVTDVSCFTGNNGSITLNLLGGTPGTNAYFDWNYNGATPSPGDPMNYTTASAGNYSVTYTDQNGCVDSASFFVNQPPAALGLSVTSVDVDCFGTPTGSIDISPFGGTAPYAFDWDTDVTGDFDDSEDLTGLFANTYEITIRDFNACTYNQTISITQPASALFANATSTGVSCFGGSDGEVEVSTISGGTPPYNYEWSNSNFVFAQNTSSLQNVPSDVYSVDITDANGCSTTVGTTVTSPNPLVFMSEVVTHVTCFGALDGSISVAVGGGTPTLTYQWSNSSGIIPGETASTLAAQPAGDYTLLVEDANGCQLTSSYTIEQPAMPLGIITNSITDVLCYGMNTGAIDIMAVGGTPGYTYAWENSASVSMGITEDIESLLVGTYSVIVTDANGCPASGVFVVDQPQDTLIASSNITPVVCFGESNGSVNLNTTGGTSPYQFAWTNSTFQLSATTEDLINFPSDTYSVVITDANGCVFSDSYFVSEPPLLEGNIVGVDILCYGDNTGSVDLTVTGGTVAYSYLWDNGPTTQDQNNLYAGTYTVVVTDANFCQFTDSITLTQPADSIDFEYVSNPVICFGEDNGSIELTPSGGTPNYNYDWSSGDSTGTILDLTAGWYVFNITDANGCMLSDSIEVTQPDLLLANEAVTDVTCYGFSDGVIDISPTGGTGPYNYTWFNSTFALSSQEQDLVDFPHDIYHLELRDSLGCLTEIFVELPQPDPIVITSEQIDVTCAAGTDGSIDITVIGGNPGYTYDWSNGATTEDLVNIPVDEYTVVVTDTKNCMDSLSVIIYEPDTIFVDFLTTDVSCADQYNGTALAMPYGGTGDFTYEWSTGETTDLIENLYGGQYSVTVTDVVGCTGSDSVFIYTSPIACIMPPNTFTPNDDNYNDTWFLENIEIYPNMELKIFNRWGNLVYDQTNEYEEWNGIYNGQPLPSETYYYILNLNTELDPLKGTITIVR